jgi:hypothetical protein
MSKSWRLVLMVLLMYGAVTVLHLWLNVGFGRLKFLAGGTAHASYRVGYLPVT